MSFQFLTNIPLEQAKKEYLQCMLDQGLGAQEETIAVMNACGRVNARPVYANICAPHYNASAMDGIAVHAKDTFGATETTPVILKASQYLMLDTGDPIPDTYDAVIMIEDIVHLDNKEHTEEGLIKIHAAATPFQHIRQIGEDICLGEMILPSYTTITPAAIGSMLAGGVLEVPVLKKPVIGIIPTGDEIVPPSQNPGPGDIIEFNSSIFSAMLQKWGAETKVYPICKDTFANIKKTTEQALEECDMVLINAGSSAGREDLTVQVVREIGSVLHHGIAIKPGKPAILGYKGPKVILGVPGYPVSGIIVIEELLKPLIEAFTKKNFPKAHSQEATLSRPVVSGVKYQEFIRVRMGYVEGRYIATPLSRGSGVVSSFMKADGILDIPQGVEGYSAGDEIRVNLLQSTHKIKNSLVSIGSHDPLLDELSDMLHLHNEELHMVSSHTGSMGGIMAVKRREAHLAGVHLLDEEDGSYNISYIKKHFPQGGVRLIEVTGREQGFMVAKGNPKNIHSIHDLYKDNIRFVNRQKGSGTRVLFDYVNKQENLDPTSIYGYGREEFTHTSIAAQISLDSADVGMGIYSAAHMFGLDFIPVCTERYDFLIPDYAYETPMVQNVLKILKGNTFKEKLLSMGGYVLENPGKEYTL